jgi:hypothetical protein
MKNQAFTGFCEKNENADYSGKAGELPWQNFAGFHRFWALRQ